MYPHGEYSGAGTSEARDVPRQSIVKRIFHKFSRKTLRKKRLEAEQHIRAMEYSIQAMDSSNLGSIAKNYCEFGYRASSHMETELYKAALSALQKNSDRTARWYCKLMLSHLRNYNIGINKELLFYVASNTLNNVDNEIDFLVHKMKEKNPDLLDSVDVNGDTALFKAIYSGNENMIQALINNRVDISVRNEHTGYAPIHAAIEMKNTNLIRYILKEDIYDYGMSLVKFANDLVAKTNDSAYLKINEHIIKYRAAMANANSVNIARYDWIKSE
jgi:hypothetical protein